MGQSHLLKAQRLVNSLHAPCSTEALRRFCSFLRLELTARFNTRGAMGKGHMLPRKQASINRGAVRCFQRNRDMQTFGHLFPCRGTRGRLQKGDAACVPLLRCQVHGLRCYQEEPQQIAGRMFSPSSARWHIRWFISMLSFFSYTKDSSSGDQMINPASKAVSNSDPSHLSSHHVSSFHAEAAAFGGHAS